MKQYDKNSLIGFVLMAIILIVFNTFFFPEVPQKQTPTNIPTKVVLTESQTSDTTTATAIETGTVNPTINDTAISKELKATYGVFANAARGKDTLYTLENDKLKITVASKGGRITSVIIKEGPNKEQYKTYDGKDLEIFNSDSSNFNLNFSTGISINTNELFFKQIKQNSNSITMRLAADDNQFIDFNYVINEDYLIDFSIDLIGMHKLIPNEFNYIDLQWQMKTPQTEKSKTNQDKYTGIYYQLFADKDDIDYLGYTNVDDTEKISNKLSWVAFQQQFFSSILISKDGLETESLRSLKEENSKYIKDLSAEFRLPFKHESNEKIDFQFYFGPNHYKTLASYNSGFEELIPLGWGIFGWVNEYLIIPIFDLLSKYCYSFGFGIIILLLTLIIKLALSPFTYKAFLSQAKMKVLKPEIDNITEKNKGKDQMKIQQETMALYRKAGVNPMGGCLPMLFQFPILIALFQFFPASIELRQESFLWADDLSSYDSIYNFGFNIPFYGDHISLFTLLMTISTLLYTRMNSSMATGPMAQMKWIMYLMPILFLGIFNDMAAGLTYYYFLANVFTMTQQYFMTRLVDENAILAQIEANKKKPAKPKSKFQKKLEEMQKQQEQKMKKRK